MTKTAPFDAADYLDSEEALADYLREARASGDDALITLARDTAERAQRRLKS